MIKNGAMSFILQHISKYLGMVRLSAGMGPKQIQQRIRVTSPIVKHLDTGIAVEQHVRILIILHEKVVEDDRLSLYLATIILDFQIHLISHVLHAF